MTGSGPARFSCADQAAARGDPLAGTTPSTTGWLLVEHRRPWGPDAVQSTLGADLAARLHRAAHARGMRLVMVRRPGRRGDPPTRWFSIDSMRRSMRSAVVDDDDDLVTEPFAPGAGDTVEGPLYLVCTHGRHDPCCARLGRPAAQALAVLAPTSTWECSHLGGDRFAGNLLVLPTADLYGRVGPGDAERMVRASRAGQVVPELWRGRAVLGTTEQAAVATLLREGMPATDVAWDDITCDQLDGTTYRVRVPAGGATWSGLVRIGLGPPAVLTCHAPHESRPRTFGVSEPAPPG